MHELYLEKVNNFKTYVGDLKNVDNYYPDNSTLLVYLKGRDRQRNKQKPMENPCTKKCINYNS